MELEGQWQEKNQIIPKWKIQDDIKALTQRSLQLLFRWDFIKNKKNNIIED